MNTCFVLFSFVVFFAVIQGIALTGIVLIFGMPRSRKVAWIVCACIALLHSAYYFLFSPPVVSPALRRLVEYGILYPYFIYMLVCLFLNPLFIVTGAVAGARRLIGALQALWRRRQAAPRVTDLQRRRALRLVTAGVVLPVSGLSLYGSYVGGRRLVVEEREFFFPELPAGLDGLCLVQMSDIHAGPFMDAERLSEYVRIVNDLAPDVLVITGDIINWGDAYIDDAAEALAALQPRLGAYAVMGNHDYYCTMERLCSALKKAHVTVIRNSWVPVKRNDEHLFLVGTDDLRYSGYVTRGASLLKSAQEGLPASAFSVLLAHRPTMFDYAAKEGIPLTLAGHTHGGQIVLPTGDGKGISFARMAYERDAGLYQAGKSLLYVNRGLGVVGPPVRMNCPREITRLVLRAEINRPVSERRRV